MGKTTISTLNRMKASGEKIAVITSYDASFTRQIEDAGMDVILVGDSLGMVVQGHESTLPVTVSDMVYHTANVMRVSRRCMVIADMPFMSHGTPQQALDTAGRLMKEGGAHMVKIEGGAPQLETVRHLTDRAVPVCGHLGLMPQSIHQLGELLARVPPEALGAVLAPLPVGTGNSFGKELRMPRPGLLARHRLLQDAPDFATLAECNVWLEARCRALWQALCWPLPFPWMILLSAFSRPDPIRSHCRCLFLRLSGGGLPPRSMPCPHWW